MTRIELPDVNPTGERFARELNRGSRAWLEEPSAFEIEEQLREELGDGPPQLDWADVGVYLAAGVAVLVMALLALGGQL